MAKTIPVTIIIIDPITGYRYTQDRIKMAEKVFEVFGRVDDPDLYFAHHVANVRSIFLFRHALLIVSMYSV